MPEKASYIVERLLLILIITLSAVALAYPNSPAYFDGRVLNSDHITCFSLIGISILILAMLED